MRIGEEQETALAGDSGAATETCSLSYVVAVKVKKTDFPPSCTMDMTIGIALFWNADAETHANDAKNKYVVQGARVLPWDKSDEQILEVPITEAEYNSDKVTVFIFSGPPASATFRKPGDTLAVGRLKLTQADIKNKGTPQRSTTRCDREILFEVEIVEAPLFYMIQLMHQNLSHPAVDDMRHWPPAKREEVMTTLGFPAELRDGFMGRAYALTTDGSYLENMSEFDLKPLFSPHWGTRNRIENNERAYYYDVWSNMHYGFIGNASGLSAEQLNGLAGMDPRGDSPADQRATTFGWQLYQGLPEAARTGSLAAKQQALYQRVLEELRRENLYLDPSF
ncbi:MAG: polymorphic toxin type 44 domain-containing protein [Polyangiaceae bacterium]